MATVRERHLQMRRDHLAVLARLLRAAQRRGDIVPAPPARQLAIGLHALVDGLIQNWMLDPASFALRAVGGKAVEAHLAGLSLPALPAGQEAGAAGHRWMARGDRRVDGGKGLGIDVQGWCCSGRKAASRGGGSGAGRRVPRST